ncbi:MAG: hypothetical protein JXQ75_05175, partial [Phycisphaerae bacterium]|nr:hypothetical protein [Phycisphaerae bacterium]
MMDVTLELSGAIRLPHGTLDMSNAEREPSGLRIRRLTATEIAALSMSSTRADRPQLATVDNALVRDMRRRRAARAKATAGSFGSTLALAGQGANSKADNPLVSDMKRRAAKAKAAANEAQSRSVRATREYIAWIQQARAKLKRWNPALG